MKTDEKQDFACDESICFVCVLHYYILLILGNLKVYWIPCKVYACDNSDSLIWMWLPILQKSIILRFLQVAATLIIIYNCQNVSFYEINSQHKIAVVFKHFTVAIVKAKTIVGQVLANFHFILTVFPIPLSNFQLCFPCLTLPLMPRTVYLGTLAYQPCLITSNKFVLNRQYVPNNYVCLTTWLYGMPIQT